MKFHAAASFLLLLAVPSCDKAKDLLSKAKAAAPKPAPSAAPASAPAAAPTRPADLTMLRDTASFDEFISTKGPLMVTHFHWEGCEYSKGMCKVLDMVGGEYAGRVKIGRIDTDEAPKIGRREKVNSYPHLRLYRDGKMVEEVTGFMVVSQVQALFEKHIQGIPVTAAPPSPSAADTPAPAAEPAIQPMKKNWLPPGIERR